MSNYNIELTNEKGYEVLNKSLEETIEILNKELDKNRTIFIDGKPFDGKIVTAESLSGYKKEICVTNQLVGG